MVFAGRNASYDSLTASSAWQLFSLEFVKVRYHRRTEVRAKTQKQTSPETCW